MLLHLTPVYAFIRFLLSNNNSSGTVPDPYLMPVLLCYNDQSILRTYLTLSLSHFDRFISRYHKIYRERYFGTENSDVEELE